MKEHALRLTRNAAGLLLATHFFSGGGPGPIAPHTILSVSSCQHFLNSYTPDMDSGLLDGANGLSYKETVIMTIYPNPTHARETIAPVVSVLKKESAAGDVPLKELVDAYNSLPSQENVQEMQDRHVNNTTFARQRREMFLAQSQLQHTVRACAQIVPEAQRRDGWYVQDKTDQQAAAFWEKYGLAAFLLLGFLGIGVLEKLFVDSNS